MVDLYCERVGPGFLAEPLNAITNLAFFLAAWAAWSLARKTRTLSPGIGTAVGLMVAIGIGSTLFHTLATTWARVLDLIPILLFQLTFLWIYGRKVINLRPVPAALSLVAFLAAALIGRLFPNVLNGSLTYAPAVALLVVLGVWHALARTTSRFTLLSAAVIFAAAIAFRSVDSAVCAAWPVGTHFVWHLLVPAVLYLSMRALITNAPVDAAKA